MSLEKRIDTIPKLLKHRVETTPSDVALSEKGDSQQWTRLTWKQFDRRVDRLTQQLLAAGLKPGDQVAILMPNAVQWEVIQHALFRMGAVIVGLDLNDPIERVDDILSQCTLRALFVDNPARLGRIPRRHLKALELIVSTRPEAPTDVDAKVMTLETLAFPPKPITPLTTDSAAIATIIFTSGTTGRPKALWYTHQQILLAVRSITRLFSDLPAQASTACWLPLANPFQRIINLCAISANWQCFVVPDPARIMSEVREIEPHFFAGVPRFFEKLFQAIETGIHEMPSWQRILAGWAIGIGRAMSDKSVGQDTISWRLRWMHRIAEAVVLKKMRRLMGNNLKYFISGSAPLSSELIKKCFAYGWPIHEAYGISENILPMAMNSPGAARWGSVGRPLPENTIRIAEDGEVLVKSACVAANLTVGANGAFLGTGDLGRLDGDGYLWLIGRKNDTFKLSTGRKVIPKAIEEVLSAIDGVDHCIALGHNRKQVIALLNVPRERWHHLTASKGGEMGARSVLKRKAQLVCSHLPRYCQPADVVIVNDPFSPGTGELTTNLKLRRSAVLAKYSSSIDLCYQQIEKQKA